MLLVKSFALQFLHAGDQYISQRVQIVAPKPIKPKATATSTATATNPSPC